MAAIYFLTMALLCSAIVAAAIWLLVRVVLHANEYRRNRHDKRTAAR